MPSKMLSLCSLHSVRVNKERQTTTKIAPVTTVADAADRVSASIVQLSSCIISTMQCCWQANINRSRSMQQHSRAPTGTFRSLRSGRSGVSDSRVTLIQRWRGNDSGTVTDDASVAGCGVTTTARHTPLMHS